MPRRRRTGMVVLACGATAFQQPRARRALVRLNAEEPDLAELKSLFEAQPRAPRADDDAAGDDDDDDDGDLGSLFAPPPAREVSAAERDAGTYKLAAGGAAVLLLATTFLATQ